MFTFFEDSTISLLYLLNNSFKTVHVFKPSSSKSGNSEVYVVCLHFKGLQVLHHLWETLLASYESPDLKTGKSMFDVSDINWNFLLQISDCADFFMERQIETIKENVENFNNKQATEVAKMTHRKKLVAARYIKRCRLRAIPKQRKLVVDVENLNDSSFYFRQWNCPNSWSYREDFQEFSSSSLGFNEKLLKLLNIKLGKPLERVVCSNFCSKECVKLNVSDFQSVDTSDLLNTMQMFCNVNANVFSVVDFTHETKQHDFHFSLFSSIREKLNQRNFIFLKIPFVTNFLVGILYLLLFAYEKAIFHKNGSVTLCNLIGRVNEVKECFDAIHAIYSENKGDKLVDVNQIIPLNVMYNHDFINLVWNYNNVTCA